MSYRPKDVSGTSVSEFVDFAGPQVDDSFPVHEIRVDGDVLADHEST